MTRLEGEHTPSPTHDRGNTSAPAPAPGSPLLESMGGTAGFVYSTVPVVVFVIALALLSTKAAVIAAVATGAVLIRGPAGARGTAPRRLGQPDRRSGRGRHRRAHRLRQGLLPAGHLGGLRRIPRHLRFGPPSSPPDRCGVEPPARGHARLARGPSGSAGTRHSHARSGERPRRPVRGQAVALRARRHRLARIREDRHGHPPHRGRRAGRRLGLPCNVQTSDGQPTDPDHLSGRGRTPPRQDASR